MLTATSELVLRPDTLIDRFDNASSTLIHRVELNDGRHFQMSEKMVSLLQSLRHPLRADHVPGAYEAHTGDQLPIDRAHAILSQLIERGIVVHVGEVGEAAAPAVPKHDSLMGLQYRRDLVRPEFLAPFANAMRLLFAWPVAMVLMTVIALAHIVAYREGGFPVGQQVSNVNWFVLYSMLVASILVHELGHLAACRRWACPHGPLGFGLYFFNPVFYVDVTAAWKLNRWQRVVVDVGGMYVQLLFVPFYWLLYVRTGDYTFLMAIFLTDMLILSNFEPFMKLDGYWLLSDLTGVANLHSRTGEIVKQMAAWLLSRIGVRRMQSATSGFSQWSAPVKIVIGFYVFLSVIMWPIIIVAMVPLAVNVVTTYPAVLSAAFADIAQALQTGELAVLPGALQSLFLPTLMLLNVGYMVKSMVGRARKRRQTHGMAAAPA